EQRARYVGGDAREERRKRPHHWPEPSPRLVTEPAHPDAQVQVLCLGPPRPASLDAPSTRDPAGLRRCLSGELIGAAAGPLAAADQRRFSLREAITPLLSSSVAPGCPAGPRGRPTVSMENGAT